MKNLPREKIEKRVPISVAARFLGVSVDTLRRWDASGKYPADFRTPGNDRRYDMGRLREFLQSLKKRVP
ncbi:MerR family DNA-binding transcriptional regulator [Acidithiobacillus sp. IBUN Pt1247-S3]|uniref:MerR family DNA-binding transcriptional regulator n=1 Tax=Acidithiobacillus sp. IBUN Pt1247-S3 TaxID=3166642 RepID=UPI0034E55E9E